MLRLFRSMMASGAALAALGAAVSAPAGAVTARTTPTATLTATVPCHVAGVPDLAVCHTIRVPEDRSRPEGRTIDLRVAVLPATGRRDGAFYMFAGGPGQAAGQMGSLVGAALDGVRRNRDIVLMDQRGTGASAPLSCDPGTTEPSFTLELEPMLATVAACRAGWDADLRRYSTLDVVEDVEAVRTVLGHGPIDVWGGSWGTRTALLYMRAYPAAVRSAVLDAVTPPNLPLLPAEPAFSQAALDALFRDCAADTACAAAFPDLGARFTEWLGTLGPDATLDAVSAETGAIVPIAAAPVGLSQGIRGALYSPAAAARLPHALDRAIRGDATAMLPLTTGSAAVVRDTMFLGATLSGMCREEVPRLATTPLSQGFTGDGWSGFWAALCADWPVDPLPDGYADPVTVDVPVLLLSGALDPITPPASADAAAAHLPRAWHLTVPKGGHIVSGTPCADDLIAQFVKAASGDGLDASCLTQARRPPFMTGPMGPTP